MNARVANLLDDLSEAQADLQHAQTQAQADAARADIASVTHSLWLAGYEPQVEEQAA